MTLFIDYRLVGAGWSRCKVSFGEVELDLTASYLSDALASLILGAVAVLANAASVSFGFDEEPGEYRWAISRTTATEIKVRLLEFEELWSNKPDSDGQVMAEFVCNALEFGVAVQAAANEVLARHGLLGYKEAWVEHEFPSKQLDLLSDYVSKWKSWQK
jgi:hypothetical protein